MKKILSLFLAVLMVVAMIPTAFAITQICGMCGSEEFTNHNGIHSFSNAQCQACGHCWACADNDECYCSHCASTNYTNGTDVEYDAEADNDGDGQPDHSEAWTVTVPALLEPSSEGNVVAQGTWASNRKLVVTADETVTLANSINTNDTKILDIGFAGIELAGSNTAAVSATEAVGVADIEDALFGTWSGTFYYDVEMVDNIQIANFAISYYSYENGQDTWTPKTYQFEQGMTWGEWINSPYNIDGFIKSNYGDNVHDAANNNYVERIINQTEGGATHSEAVQISHVILDAGEYRVVGFPN